MADRGKRYSEEQILSILKEAGASGAKVGEVLRRHAVTPKTYYRWKAKYSGLELSELKRMRQLEEENRRLKKLVADQALDNQILRELLGKD